MTTERNAVIIDAADELANEFGYWNECPTWPLVDWRNAIMNGDTRLGYWDWIVSQSEAMKNLNHDQ